MPARRGAALPLALLPLCLLLLGCVTHVVPSPARAPSPLPPLADSVVVVPVRMDLSGAPAWFAKELPNPLATGRVKKKIPVMVAVAKPVKKLVDVTRREVRKVLEKVPTRIRKVGCVLTPSECFDTVFVDKWVDKVVAVVEKVETTVVEKVNERSPFDVELGYGLSLVSVDFDLEGTTLTASLVADAWLDGKLDATIAKVGLASCGVGEKKPRIQLTVTGTIGLTAEGRLTFERTARKLAWLEPCKITALEIDVEDLMRISVIRDFVDKKLDETMDALPASYSLAPHLQKAWEKLSATMPVTDSAWLRVNPVAIAFGAPTGAGKIVSTVVAITARPRLTYGAAPPASPAAPLPPLGTVPKAQRFRVFAEGEVTLDAAQKALRSALAGKQVVEGREVDILGADLYGGSGGKLVVELDVASPFHGRLYLEGTPTFEANGEIIRVADLDFTLATRDVVGKVADYFLHDQFRDKLREKAVFPVGPARLQAETALKQLRRSGEGYALAIDTEKVRVIGVYVDRTAIRAAVEVEGAARLDLSL